MTMTAEDRAALRVAAAEDVLKRIIPDESLEISTQCYLNVDYETKEPCKACAAGALTLAVIAPHILGELPYYGQTLAESMHNQFLDHATLDSYDIRATLLELFDEDQIALIEAAFMHGFIGEFANRRFTAEDGQRYYASDIHEHYYAAELLNDPDLALYEKLQAAVEFGLPYGYEDERLAAIMQNIVKNGGTFVPEED